MRALVIVLLAAALCACSDQIYEIPTGYKGWVEVDLANPSCPPLRSEGWSKVVSISRDGHGCTADELPSGLNRTRYFFVENGERKPIARDLINGEVTAADNVAGRPARKYLAFFIGPRAEMKGFGSPRLPIKR